MFSALTKFPQVLYRRIAYGLMAMVLAVGIGLATPTPSQAGLLDLIFHGIRYVQLGNLSERDEVNLGRQIDQQLKARGVRIYNGNPAINQYINEIGQRLAQTSDRPQSALYLPGGGRQQHQCLCHHGRICLYPNGSNSGC